MSVDVLREGAFAALIPGPRRTVAQVNPRTRGDDLEPGATLPFPQQPRRTVSLTVEARTPVDEEPVMPWTPLSIRLQSLPLILSGPIPRRVEPHAVTVWVALRQPKTVTLRVYE